MAKTPGEALFDKVDFKCLACGRSAKDPACKCWTRCPCGWYFAAGTACSNPIHRQDFPTALSDMKTRGGRRR